MEQLLAPLLIGEESTRIEGLWQDMYREVLLHGRTGSLMRALSAIDTALWDLNARTANLPLYKYLGHWAKTDVPAYASGGYYLDGKTPQMLGEEVASYVEAGFNAVKIKVGRASPADDEERVRASRMALGDDGILMLDANNAWSDLPTAMQYCERFAKYSPYWIEEPFGPDDLDNHAKLALATRLTVATGEIEAGRWRFKQLLDNRCADVLQADAAVCGGISEWRRIADLASSYGVTMAPHWFHDLHVHLVASASNATFVEFFPDDLVLNFRVLIDRQLVARKGKLMLPSEPGLAFQFDDKALQKYITSPWQNVRKLEQAS
jgi:L-alanine-DL-glutamate epimerase-like enolase superfamily enzyme